MEAVDDLCPPVKLPKGDLVYLSQKGEGIDPFDLFEEGLDLANENPLSIENNDGVLEIGIGGFSYADGEDGAKITALAYSQNEKRFSIKTGGYELLIEIAGASAKVLMKEGKSRFKEVVAYGA